MPSVFRQIEIFKICLKSVLCQKTPTLSFGEQRGEKTFASHFQKTTITHEISICQMKPKNFWISKDYYR